MSAHVEHIIDATRDAVVAVFVAKAAVTRKIKAGVCTKVSLAASLVVAIGCAEHSRPRRANAQISAYSIAENFGTMLVDQHGINTRHGKGGKRRLGRGHAREVSDHNTPGFGLPPGVNNRTLALAYVAVVPIPGLFVDGFTDGSEHLEAVQALTL